MTWTTSENGFNVDRSFEGRSLRAYRDEVGVWTIGYGNTNDEADVLGFEIKAGVTITEQQAEDLLRAAVRRKYEPAVNRAMGGPLMNQFTFDAGQSFHYNTGAIGRASWVKSFVAGSLTAIHPQILQWNKAGGKVLAGLTRRRNREWEMISSGNYGPEGANAPLDMTTGKPIAGTAPATPVGGAPLPAPADSPGASGPSLSGAGLTPWHARMDSLLGMYEGTDNAAIVEMAKVCGGSIAKTYTNDSIAWCALTVNFCLVSTGFKGNDSLLALDVRKIGTSLQGPAVGALATRKRTGGGHTFIVRGRTADGKLVGTGGNQANMVCDELQDAMACEFNWPAGYRLPQSVGIGTLPIVTVRPKGHVTFTSEDVDHMAVAHKTVPGHLAGTPGMLQRGDQGPEVADAQRLLIACGLTVDADGEFGPATEHAVRDFQHRHPQLDQTGILDPGTRATLARDAKAKATLKDVGKAGAGGLATTAGAHSFLGLHPVFTIAVAVVIVAGLCYVAWKYRDEIRGMLAKPLARGKT